jgi:CRP/FNR family transcriptional regulator
MSGTPASISAQTVDPGLPGRIRQKLPKGNVKRFLAEETILRGAPAEALENLSEVAVETFVPRNSTFFSMGETSGALHFVVEGTGLLVKSASNGRQQVLHRALPGDVVGCVAFFDGQGYPASFVAESDCVVLSIPRDRLLELFRSHPALAFPIVGCLAERLRSMANVVEKMSFEDTTRRLWGFLLESSTATAGEGFPRVLDPLPTREHLARSIGTVREVVSRQLSRLAESGHLKMEGKRLVLLKPLTP